VLRAKRVAIGAATTNCNRWYSNRGAITKPATSAGNRIAAKGAPIATLFCTPANKKAMRSARGNAKSAVSAQHAPTSHDQKHRRYRDHRDPVRPGEHPGQALLHRARERDIDRRSDHNPVNPCNLRFALLQPIYRPALNRLTNHEGQDQDQSDPHNCLGPDLRRLAPGQQRKNRSGHKHAGNIKQRRAHNR